MFQNYLITALRNFSRHKLYSFINIAGLTVGLACAIFIILFVRDQLSYDRWIPGTENLYRVETSFAFPGREPFFTAHTPFVVTEAMAQQIPEVRARTRLIRSPITVSVGERQFPEMMDSVDPNFFRVIKLPLTAGDAASVLAEPNSVVLSEARARKYFGGAPALGTTIIISVSHNDDQGNQQLRQYPLTVTGILRDLPHNTQLAADLVMSNVSQADPTPQEVKTNWVHTEGWGYVLLAPGADPDQVTAKLKTIIDHNVDPRKLGHLDVKGSQLMVPILTPFRDDHLSSDKFGGGITPPGSWTTVYGFAAIGLLILLVACFNFTNLATARALVRAREISLRKVVGATRWQLVTQFLGESILTSLISLLLALALSEILLPEFDRLANAPIELHYSGILPFLVGISIVVGLSSGIYPALVLSGIRPGLVLRSSGTQSTGSGLLRTSLVVLQFAISIGLGIAALVVFAQISFARHVDLGFHKDGILLIDASSLSTSQRDTFVKSLHIDPDITDAAFSNVIALPFTHNNNTANVSIPGGPSNLIIKALEAGPGYAGVYGIRLVTGRLLSEQRAGDIVTDIHLSNNFFSSAPYNILINESAAHLLGYSAAGAVHKTVKVRGTPVTIVGVVADTKMDGVDSPITPTLYRYIPPWDFWVSARVRPEHLSDTLAFIDRTWRALAPNAVINRHFLNDDFEKQFLADEQQDVIFTLFVGIAIFIACLGLFGLAAFSTERRTKEIGLRKTFGARTWDIVWMLLWQFSVPVLVANLIAWPVAYYYLHHWLEGYAYRISLSPLYFVGAGAAALVIAWATVIVHAAHVARANPIHALRHE